MTVSVNWLVGADSLLTMAVAVDVVSALGRGDGGIRDVLSSTGGGESTAVSWFRTRGGSLGKRTCLDVRRRRDPSARLTSYER